jgi:hypothetical protein
MNETEDFLAAMIPRQVEADTALHNGDAAPRLAIWFRARSCHRAERGDERSRVGRHKAHVRVGRIDVLKLRVLRP